jgi:hypothetical protein
LYRSSRDGSPTIRHPIYEWPSVDDIVKNEDSFLIGDAIRISANFDLNAKGSEKEFKSAFAKGRYADFYHYSIKTVKEESEMIDLYSGFDFVNIHVIEGNIVPFQDSKGVKVTRELLEDQMRLLVFPTESGYAKGHMYVANGNTVDEKQQYIEITHADQVIQFNLLDGDADVETMVNEVIEEIHIVGTENVETVDFACFLNIDGDFKPLNIETATSQDKETKYIRIYGGTNTIEFDQTQSIFYGTKSQDYNYCEKKYTARRDSGTDTEIRYT